MKPVRVIVVDDELPARNHLRTLPPVDGSLEVIGKYGDGRDVIDAVHRDRPDGAFLDVHLPLGRALCGTFAQRVANPLTGVVSRPYSR